MLHVDLVIDILAHWGCGGYDGTQEQVFEKAVMKTIFQLLH